MLWPRTCISPETRASLTFPITTAMAGMRRAIRRPMIRMTTSNSIRVKPSRRLRVSGAGGWIIGPISGCVIVTRDVEGRRVRPRRGSDPGTRREGPHPGPLPGGEGDGILWSLLPPGEGRGEGRSTNQLRISSPGERAGGSIRGLRRFRARSAAAAAREARDQADQGQEERDDDEADDPAQDD